MTESYKDIGAVLRQARMDMKLSLREAGVHVHIRAHYLEALEQGQLNKLPGLPYARGFLQTYCHFLGLDREEMMRRFEQVEDRLAAQSLKLPEVFSKEKSPSRGIIWGSLVFGLVFYVFWRIVFKPMPAAVDMAGNAPPPPPPSIVVQPLNLACFRPAKTLYPPCYVAKAAVIRLYPPRSQINSVMELAIQ